MPKAQHLDNLLTLAHAINDAIGSMNDFTQIKFAAFRHNKWFGAAIFAGIVAELNLRPWLAQ